MAILRIGKWKVVSNVALRYRLAENEIVIYPDGGGTVSININSNSEHPFSQQDVPLSNWVTVNGRRVAGRWPFPAEIAECEYRSTRGALSKKTPDPDGAPYRRSKHTTKKIGAARKRPKKRHPAQQRQGRRR